MCLPELVEGSVKPFGEAALVITNEVKPLLRNAKMCGCAELLWPILRLRCQWRDGLDCPFRASVLLYWATEGAALGYDGTAFQAGLSTSCPTKNAAQRLQGLRM